MRMKKSILSMAVVSMLFATGMTATAFADESEQRININQDFLNQRERAKIGIKNISNSFIVNKRNEVKIVGINKIDTEKIILDPAGDAGLQIGDVIVEVNDNTINNQTDLKKYIQCCNGNPLKLKVIRNNSEKVINIQPIKGKDGNFKIDIETEDTVISRKTGNESNDSIETNENCSNQSEDNEISTGRKKNINPADDEKENDENKETNNSNENTDKVINTEIVGELPIGTESSNQNKSNIIDLEAKKNNIKVNVDKSDEIRKDKTYSKVTVINVGAGDCILISSPNKNNEMEHMLIDTGDNKKEWILINKKENKSEFKEFKWDNIEKCLEKNKVKKFKYVVITHPHEDHYMNFGKIKEKYEIEKLIVGQRFKDKDLYCYCCKLEKINKSYSSGVNEDLENEAKFYQNMNKGVKLIKDIGKVESLSDDIGEGNFEILNSKLENEFEECKNEAKRFCSINEQFNLNEMNDLNKLKNAIENLKRFYRKIEYQMDNSDSIVIKLKLGEKMFLFCGDCNPWNLSYLTNKYGDGLKADYLKLPHHGRKSITDHEDAKQLEERERNYQNFINKVNPKYVIISDDKCNTSKDEEHIRRFSNAKIYNTCEGNIKEDILEIYHHPEVENNDLNNENENHLVDKADKAA